MVVMIGKLYIYFGTMFAGKSTKLYQIYSTVEHARVYQHSSTGINYIKSRNRPSELIYSTSIRNLKDINERNCKNVLIDEFQFFNNGNEVEVISGILDMGVDVYIFGLISDYNKKPFGSINKLLHLAYSSVHMKTICHTCKIYSAVYNKLIGSEEDEINALYIPVCPECY
jgi:thymidine kinase